MRSLLVRALARERGLFVGALILAVMCERVVRGATFYRTLIVLPSAVAPAVAGVLWSGYFFFSPYYSFYLARPNEILNLLLFMVVAVVTSHLANSMKKQTELARKSEKEMGDLYAFSRRLAAASSALVALSAEQRHPQAPTLSTGDLNKFLHEEKRSLAAVQTNEAKATPAVPVRLLPLPGSSIVPAEG